MLTQMCFAPIANPARTALPTAHKVSHQDTRRHATSAACYSYRFSEPGKKSDCSRTDTSLDTHSRPLEPDTCGFSLAACGDGRSEPLSLRLRAQRILYPPDHSHRSNLVHASVAMRALREEAEVAR
jgi:hypothetical protein